MFVQVGVNILISHLHGIISIARGYKGKIQQIIWKIYSSQ